MFRIVGTRKTLLSTPAQRVVVSHLAAESRRYASQSGQAANGSNRPLVAAGVALLGVSGVYLLSKPRQSFAKCSDHGSDAPAIDPNAAEDITSPVKIYTLEEADQKIREGAESFKFEGKYGQGRVDVTRLGSNTRVEDEWDVGFGEGVGAQKTLYAGVYDGHA
jgi:pyruvate dehydrogenase phosphatase